MLTPSVGDVGAPALGRLALELLASTRRRWELVADAAIDQGLAGLVHTSWPTSVSFDGPDEIRRRLEIALRQESILFEWHRTLVGGVLGALSDAVGRPLPFKGITLSPFWPADHLRPPGDLDVLVPREDLDAAVTVLRGSGYETVGSPRDRIERGEHSVPFVRPGERRPLVVDLHVEPFRSVGSGIRGSDILARAIPATICGHEVRGLDDADRLLVVFVHAAKHGVRSLRWLLDLLALALASDGPTWDRAVARALEARSARPLFFAASMLDAVAPRTVPREVIDATRPAAAIRMLAARSFTVDRTVRGRAPSLAESRALEVLLEDRVGNVASRTRRMIMQRFTA